MDILVVDDSRTMRVILQRAIRQAGYPALTVEEAENGSQALEKLRAAKAKLIMSDWNMPEMSGIDLLRELRAGANETPFIFVTSESSADIRKIALETGANMLLTKPFTTDDIQEALAPILG